MILETLELSVLILIEVMGYLILARVIMSMLASEESRIYLFCCAVTEPVVAPVRALLFKIPAMENSPIDFSFMATYLLLTICRFILLSVS
ncbi:MAG: YggT family protein [Clostridia bacterium]|nr:YggT family protein [Clostridia bacterium]